MPRRNRRLGTAHTPGRLYKLENELNAIWAHTPKGNA
jgi:hypothetical protein